jgi:eukaryotic-like serine/threonine-protein kinase
MQTGPRGHQDNGQQPGATLQNRYLIQGVLGVGGMGSVYRARDMRFPNVTKLVAVKEILNLAPDPTVRELIVHTFEREANILATLSHPSIPQIYDYFTQGDRSFLVQEFIEGSDLEAYLEKMPGLLSADLVVEWAIQLCDVLSYLHNHKPDPIVFRDMKPSNVMLDQHQRIRLIDFGIARGFAAGQKGTMIGTEGYSPPEQYRGEASPTGDIYALGATLHHLLSKRDPRVEPPFSFAERPLPAINPSVSSSLNAIVYTALNYNPADRFASAQAMKEALLSLRRASTSTIATKVDDSRSGADLAPTAIGDVEPIWRFKCEDEVRSSPLVENGMVFVGAYDNNLYALNAKDGKLVWKYATDGGLPGSPVAFKDLILVGSEDRRLHAVSARGGRIQWSYYADGPIRSTPSIGDNHAFFGADDSYLHAVNLITGRGAWRVQVSAPVRSRPALTEDRIYFGSEGGELYCVDYGGELNWRFKAKRAVTSSPLVYEGAVFFGSVDSHVYALETASGWTIWKFRANKAVISSPAIDGHVLFVGSADGHVYAIDIRSGREVWRYATENQVTSSPAVANGVVYIGSVDGHVYALDAANGRLRWKFRSGGPITSSPAVVNGIVYIGSNDHHIFALSA